MLRISLTDRRVQVDGRPVSVPPALFELLCLLAYHRACGRERYVTQHDVRRLPRWGRASLDSVGKSACRYAHLLKQRGFDVIESPPRGATKLFRLHGEIRKVSFDVPLPDLRTYLRLDLGVSNATSEQTAQSLRLTWDLVRARTELERGNLSQARRALEEVGGPPTPVRDRVQFLLLWSNLLEHEGRFPQALDKTREALTACVELGADHLTLARAHIRLGFLQAMFRRPELYHEARGNYTQALQLVEGSAHFAELSQIAAGLGHLARREGDLASARSYFLTALEYASAESWAWGIQAALFNLGLVQAERGDMIREPRARRAAYEEAKTWLQRAIEFTDRTGIGRYSSEALSILASVLLGLGNAGAALEWARKGLARAREVGNRKSEAVALEALGRVLHSTGVAREARKALEDARAIYLDLGFQPDADRVTRAMSVLNTHSAQW